MQVNQTADYLIWDNTEAGTHVSKRSGGDVETAIAISKSRPLNFKELAASNGVYTAKDRAWIIPTALLSDAKPGDKWRDGNNVTWTVLEAPKYCNDTRLKLICRDLVLANDLRDAIDIQRAAVTYDAAAGKVRTWPPSAGSTPYSGIPAKVQKITDELVMTLGIHGFKGNFAVIVGQDVTLSGNDRVKFGSTFLDIVGQHNPTRIDELPVLDCVLMA